MGGFVTKSYGSAVIAALVGAVVSIGTLTVTGNASLNGNVTVGDANTDVHTINGRISQIGPPSTGTTASITGIAAGLALQITQGTGSSRAMDFTKNASTGFIRVAGGTDELLDLGSLSGITTLNSNLNSIFGDANTDMNTTWGHATVRGTAPGLSSCGTTPAITGNDQAGYFTTGTGGTTCTVTFSRTFTIEPACVISTSGSATQPTCTVSATAITCTVTVASTKYKYICLCPDSTCT